ncbi:MAG: pentapeptide repeat-containing protein, partial [Candidatus Marsarchaeota archaeon]|nr:pentapeptide repeat-containing protein [Candidatus Marsarchaeota archaeon]
MATKNKEAHDAQKGNGAAKQKDLGTMLRTDDSSATEQTSNTCISSEVKNRSGKQKLYTGREIVDLYRSGRRDFEGIKANDAYLRGEDLWHANLTRANLRDAYLHHADLIGANLAGANLSGADLIGANLRDADL